MDNFNWARLWAMYQQTYFGSLVLLLLALALVIYAFAQTKLNRINRIIGCYATASALQNVFCAITYLYTPLLKNNYLISTSVSLFMLVEIGTCYLFVAATNVSHLQKTIMRWLLLAYLVFAAVYTIDNYKGWYDGVLSMVELPLMLLYCSIYYYNLLTNPPHSVLLQQPLFWAIGGMGFASLVLLPSQLASDYLIKYEDLLLIMHLIPSLCYLLIFIAHFKAIQCNRKQPQL